ncbi:e9imm peptide [Streptomyces avermitilis]|uniref:e9imm peptide n=1 Tax=Streptomyces avermitilis TaxID=33903 RepID=UPI0033C55BB9
MVQKITDGEHADDAEASGILEALDRALACPSEYVSDLICWPKSRNPTAAEVVDQALAYRPLAW